MPWRLHRTTRQSDSSEDSGSDGARPSSAKSVSTITSTLNSETLSFRSSQDLTTGSLPSAPPSPQHQPHPANDISAYLQSIKTFEQLEEEIKKIQRQMAKVESHELRQIITRQEREQLTQELGFVFRTLLYTKEANLRAKGKPGDPPPISI